MLRLKLSSNNSLRKTYNLDFERDVEKDVGVYTYTDKIDNSPTFLPLENTNLVATPKRFYLVNDTTFIYLDNGSVCVEENGVAKWTSQNTYAVAPTITEIYHNGNLCVLICGVNDSSEQIAEIYNQGTVSLPAKIHHLTALVDNVFWTSDGASLYFTHIDATKGVEQNLTLDNQLFIDANYGQILDLVALENRLFIVCKHALLKVIVGAYPLDYKAQRIDTEILNVLEKSVVGSGNNLMFISNGKFCLFNGANVYYKPFIRDSEKVKILDYAGHSNGHYFLPVVTNNSQKYLYCLDVNLSKRYTLNYVLGLSKNSGKGYLESLEKIVVFTTDNTEKVTQNATLSMVNQSCFYQTKPLNFNTNKCKNLLAISGKVTGEERLYILGDFGQKEIAINNAFSVECNLTSVEFSLMVNSTSQKMPLSNLKLIYRIQGE